MPGAMWLIVLTAVAPAVAALIAAVLWRRLIPAAAWSEQSALPLGLAIGFFAGYWLLPDDWAPLWPNRHWQWLPYLALAAAIAAVLPEKAGHLVRWPAFAAVAIGAAWLLVPTWDDLYPPRIPWIALVAAYLSLLTMALDALPDRLLGRVFGGSLLATFAVLTVLLLAIGASAKIAQLSAIASAALAGGFAAMFLLKLSTPRAARGLVPVFAVLAGGLAYVGTIEPEVPQPLLLLVPAAPLAWWLLALWKPRAAAASKPA
jgi:hypothetical protein